MIPLNELTKKNIPYIWSPLCHVSLYTFKVALTNSPIQSSQIQIKNIYSSLTNQEITTLHPTTYISGMFVSSQKETFPISIALKLSYCLYDD